jgi:uncharacterized membrane protein
MAFHEEHSRSLVKTITYRLIIIISNAIIIYLMTGNLNLTANFIAVTSVASTLLYFIHERMWNQIHWGKKRLPEPVRRRR